MKVYYNTNHYAPSAELKFRLRKLAEIAALSKLYGQTDLYNQAKEQHDKLVYQYNEVAKTKKKGFWGQFVDNLTNTTTSVHIADFLDKSHDYNNTISLYSKFTDRSLLAQALKSALDEWEKGSDTLSRLGM